MLNRTLVPTPFKISNAPSFDKPMKFLPLHAVIWSSISNPVLAAAPLKSIVNNNIISLPYITCFQVGGKYFRSYIRYKISIFSQIKFEFWPKITKCSQKSKYWSIPNFYSLQKKHSKNIIYSNMPLCFQTILPDLFRAKCSCFRKKIFSNVFLIHCWPISARDVSHSKITKK